MAEVAAPTIAAEMADWIRLGGRSLGIVGDPGHTYGFHRGAAYVPATDYSRRRDPQGADGPYSSWEWACAGDYAHDGKPALRERHRQLLARLLARDPALAMVCEFIGQPIAGQPVMYWSPWSGLMEYTGAGHDVWSHISSWRSMANQRPHLWIPSPQQRRPQMILARHGGTTWRCDGNTRSEGLTVEAMKTLEASGVPVVAFPTAAQLLAGSGPVVGPPASAADVAALATQVQALAEQVAELASRPPLDIAVDALTAVLTPIIEAAVADVIGATRLEVVAVPDLD